MGYSAHPFHPNWRFFWFKKDIREEEFVSLQLYPPATRRLAERASGRFSLKD
jgi:hypothetical protein